jgi:hypothetical protein
MPDQIDIKPYGITPKPCPFCGRPHVGLWVKPHCIFYVQCRWCGVKGVSRQKAVDALNEWNLRPLDALDTAEQRQEQRDKVVWKMALRTFRAFASDRKTDLTELPVPSLVDIEAEINAALDAEGEKQ